MSEVRIRDMTVDDIRAVSALRITGWRAAYAGIVPADYLDGLSIEADAKQRKNSFGNPHAQNVVAEDDQGAVGWGVVGPSRDDDARDADGEIYALYVAPSRIGTGIGRALITDLVARAARAGFTTVRLWVLAENHRARRFYERAGFALDGRRAEWTVSGKTLLELRYSRSIEITD